MAWPIKSDVSQEVTRLFVPQSLDLFFLRQPVATFNRIGKTLKLLAQRHVAMFAQVISRDDDIAWALNWKAMRPGLLQRRVISSRLPFMQKRSNCFDGTKAHARRCAGSENTEDEFFPELLHQIRCATRSRN